MSEMSENSDKVSKPPPAPKGLQKGGRALWRDMWSVFDFREEPHLLAILEQACRIADQSAELDEAMKGQPMTLPGYAGQRRIARWSGRGRC